MNKKPNYPVTALEDLSPTESLKLRDAARAYQPEDVSVLWRIRRWIPGIIIALIIAGWLWSLYGG